VSEAFKIAFGDERSIIVNPVRADIWTMVAPIVFSHHDLAATLES
jgi:hypothetical protein